MNNFLFSYQPNAGTGPSINQNESRKEVSDQPIGQQKQQLQTTKGGEGQQLIRDQQSDKLIKQTQGRHVGVVVGPPLITVNQNRKDYLQPSSSKPVLNSRNQVLDQQQASSTLKLSLSNQQQQSLVLKNQGNSNNKNSGNPNSIQGQSQKQRQLAHYRYWIDVKDLHSMILTSLNQLLESDYIAAIVCDQDASQSVIQGITGLGLPSFLQHEPKSDDVTEMNKALIAKISENDHEIAAVLTKYINQLASQMRKPVKIEDVLDVQYAGQKRVYLIENAKVVTQVYHTKQREEVIEALTKIKDLIVAYQTKYLNKTLRLCFSSQQELYSIFLKLFGPEIFSDILPRKIFSEVYEALLLFRETNNTKGDYINSYFYLKIELFCRGRALLDLSKRDYPLHKAVFENNLPLISRLVKATCDNIFYSDKNELDACGHTPLVLAVKLGYIDTIKVLCDLFACPKLKSLHSYPCALDVASSMKNKEIIKILLEANQKIKQHYLDLHKDAMFRALEALPDFKIDMHLCCQSSFIPFLQNITPSDTYKISKQGSKLRLDMTLVGFRNLKCIRGNLSVLFKGRGQTNEGELFVIDHDTKSVSNIFNDVVNAKLDKDLEDIMSDAQYQKLYKADKFQMEPEIDRRKNEILSREIEGFRAEKYNLKTTFTMTKYQISIQEVQNIQRHRFFDEYLKANAIGSLWGDFGNNTNQVLSSTSPKPLLMLKKVGGGTDQLVVDDGSSNQILSTFSSNKDGRTNTMMGGGFSTKNKKTSKKTINASIWLSKQHPLSLDSFLPLLQVLSFSSKQIAKFKDYLTRYQLPQGSFPLKAKIPIFFTMKAAFSLQNLSFDQNNLPASIFTIDEEYIHQKIQKCLNFQIKNQQNVDGVLDKPATDLKELYKLFKTNEDIENGEDEDDSDAESVERANQLYNSMLKKVQQPEDLLLDSFHSEYDSVDLCEKHLNDESFKLAAHAFSQVQTLNQINVRYDGDDIVRKPAQLPPHAFLQAQEFKNFFEAKKKLKYKGQDAEDGVNLENYYDTKLRDEDIKPQASSKKKMMLYNKPPLKGVPFTPTPGSSHSTQHASQDRVKTLKKNFQPRNLKNYKNMVKYNCNQGDFLPENPQPTASGNIAARLLLDDNISSQSISTQQNQRSTADNSIITNHLALQYKGGVKSQQNNMDEGPPLTGINNWLKQMFNYKDVILGKNNPGGKGKEVGGAGGGPYLQTIESEEVVATEGCQHEGNAQPRAIVQEGSGTASGSILLNATFVSNSDDCYSRMSLTKSQNNNQSVKSATLNPRQQKSFSESQERRNSFSRQDDRKALVNHNTLISRFHDYVVTTQLQPQSSQQSRKDSAGRGGGDSCSRLPPRQDSSIYSVMLSNNGRHGEGTPGKNEQFSLHSPTNLQGARSINHSFENSQKYPKAIGTQSDYDRNAADFGGEYDQSSSKKLQSFKSQNLKMTAGVASENRGSLIPPKVSHKRQSSQGGSTSNAQQYIAPMAAAAIIAEQQESQNTTIQNTGSGGIFGKIFSKPTSSGPPPSLTKITKFSSSQAQFAEAKTFMQQAIFTHQQPSRQEAQRLGGSQPGLLIHNTTNPVLKLHQGQNQTFEMNQQQRSIPVVMTKPLTNNSSVGGLLRGEVGGNTTFHATKSQAYLLSAPGGQHINKGLAKTTESNHSLNMQHSSHSMLPGGATKKMTNDADVVLSCTYYK